MSEPRGVHDAPHDEEMTREEIDAAMNSREHTLWQLGSILGTDHPVMVFMQNEDAENLLVELAYILRKADRTADIAAAEPDLMIKLDLDTDMPWAKNTPAGLFRGYFAARVAKIEREQASPV